MKRNILDMVMYKRDDQLKMCNKNTEFIGKLKKGKFIRTEKIKRF